MTSRYYRKPSIVVQKPHDPTFAFTMRLLNFLGDLDVWHNRLVIVPAAVENYAWRITERLNPPADN